MEYLQRENSKQLVEIKNNSYTYIYLDPRKPGRYTYQTISFLFEPFYIGQGHGDRAFCHVYFAARGEPSHKAKIIRKILKENKKPIIIFYRKNISDTDAKQFEMMLIKEIGRHDLKTGTLTNHTDGGEGYLNPSPQVRKLKSDLLSKRWESKEFRIFMSSNSSICAKKQMIEQWKDFDYRESMKKRINTWANKSIEEKQKHNNRVSVGTKNGIANLSQEEKDRLAKLRSENLSMKWLVKKVDDEEWMEVINMGKFSDEHGLCSSHMYAVAKGRLKQHKGWLCKKYEDK